MLRHCDGFRYLYYVVTYAIVLAFSSSSHIGWHQYDVWNSNNDTRYLRNVPSRIWSIHRDMHYTPFSSLVIYDNMVLLSNIRKHLYCGVQLDRIVCCCLMQYALCWCLSAERNLLYQICPTWRVVAGFTKIPSSAFPGIAILVPLYWFILMTIRNNGWLKIQQALGIHRII